MLRLFSLMPDKNNLSDKSHQSSGCIVRVWLGADSGPLCSVNANPM